MNAADFDVLVVGGGLAGLAFALLLRESMAPQQHDRTIGVLESGPAPPPGNLVQEGLRVIAVSPASRALLQSCGAWASLPAGRVSPYRRMVVWHRWPDSQRRDRICFDAADSGIPELGCIVESDLLRAALWQKLQAQPKVIMRSRAVPRRLVEEAACLGIELEDGEMLRGRLLVGADGASSWLREALRVPVDRHSYGQRAVVARVASEKPHAETAWQRFLASGPVALLPLADGSSSLVWSCPDEMAERLVGIPEETFNRELTEGTDRVLGELRLRSPRVAFPLAAAHAVHYTGRRYALIGDAAHVVHPLAGLGANLGFMDAAALAATLAAHLRAVHADPGDARVLRRFERQRRGPNLLALKGLDALNRAFTSDRPGVVGAAAAGMQMIDRLGPLKQVFSDFAMGAPPPRRTINAPVAGSDPHHPLR